MSTPLGITTGSRPIRLISRYLPNLNNLSASPSRRAQGWSGGRGPRARSDRSSRQSRSSLGYQTYARTSPPRPLRCASRPVMSPDEVETMATPRPPSTRGISLFRAYTRRPGFEMRRRPATAGSLPTYLRRNTSSRAFGCSYPEMKPSSRRMRATSAFIRLVGMDTVSCRATAALRTRVRRSATGSFGIPIPFGRTFFGAPGFRAGRSDQSAVSAAGSRNAVISSVNTNLLLPARLRDARQLADQRALAEADPAEAELSQKAARPAAHLAAVVHPHRELGRALRFQDEAFLCHRLLLTAHAEACARMNLDEYNES